MGKSKKSRFADVFPRFKRYLIFARFMLYVDTADWNLDACWLWSGGTFRSDTETYGQFWWPEKGIRSAHTAAYELFIGSRNGLCVCHSCDNRICVNPTHLWLGTNKDNTQDMIRKQRKFVRRGDTSNFAKLDWDKVEEIRRLQEQGFSQKRIAEKYGVDPSTVSYILSRKTWTIQ